MKMKKSILIIVGCLFTFILKANIILPEIISDNMVLQQNSEVKLWGKARANTVVKIKASWDKQIFKTQSDQDGHWLVKIPTPSATYTPQTLEISDGDLLKVNNILIGEVWFCSGQSNMDMPLNGFKNTPIAGSNEVLTYASNYKGLRYVKIEQYKVAVEPQETCNGKWAVSNPENLQWCSATAFFFAHSLIKALNVPVGIIDCSLGGSRVEGWLPKEILETYPDVKPVDDVLDSNVPLHMKPMIMYNTMLKPLVNFTIKGFLWYQGESNVGQHHTYADRLAAMVSHWRKVWGLGELPFYYVEIAPFTNYGDGDLAAYLREAQFKAQSLIPNSGIISTNDLVGLEESDNIHPKNKKDIGIRLAYMALKNTYGFRGISDRGPSYQSIEVRNDHIIVHFNNTENAFNRLRDIYGFEIAGEDRVFYPAKAFIFNDIDIMVSSEHVKKPVAVRYCFRNYMPGNLANSRELPVYPFRTDNW